MGITYAEMLLMNSKVASPKPKRKLNDREHQIQCACVKWFRLQYPKMAKLLIAPPNGGARNPVEGAKKKAEGMTSGVADLVLFKSNRFYGTLCIEMKTKTGRQSESQKEWQKLVEANGHKYVVCRSLDDFIREVKEYLKYT